MIKRNESKKPSNKRRQQAKRRKLAVEGLEQRRLLAAGTGGGTALPNVTLQSFTDPRNIGTVESFLMVEPEGVGERGVNEGFNSATPVPLGTGTGQEDTIDITGSIGFTIDGRGNPIADVDVYSFDLKAGDILDIALQGAASNITVFYGGNTSRPFELWFGTDFNIGSVIGTTNSPLQDVGNATMAQVVPEDGTYYLYLAPSSTLSNYTVGLRAYRPVIEQTPIGTQQIIFLDFDGGIYPTSVFDPAVPPSVVRYPPLTRDLDLLGIINPQPGDVDQLILDTVRHVEDQFARVGQTMVNGDFDSTGNPGDFGITILNSLEHPDPGVENPLVTRILVGGTDADTGISTIGLAQSLDVGNFNLQEFGFVLIDALVGVVTGIPTSPTRSILDAVSLFLAGVISHEVGHVIGNFHTENENFTPSIMDAGGGFSAENLLGVGIDGIYGTSDDLPVEFTTDEFERDELPIVGFERTNENVAFVLGTGTLGGSVSGRIFNDVNGDGNSALDQGLAGVTVFVDLNGDGALSVTEPSAVSAADGSFVISAVAGTHNVIALTPPQFSPTTATTQPATLTLTGGTEGLEFGFIQVIPDITGTKFADLDGDGIFDPNEPGIEGTYIYLDLDGDDRPDVGEPGAETTADGTYSLNFPGPGTYTIREVLEPGFVQSFPATGEHTVFFDGTALTQNYNFGNIPSRDFGDAPDSYATLSASNGASHGLTNGLSLGTLTDRELNGVPTTAADGDDSAGLVQFDGSIADDEDGVRLLSPLGPGDSATFEVTTTNSSGSPAFLQAWMDFNIDGDFDDPGEQFVTDLQLATGTHSITVNVPTTAIVGTTYARFRYSQTAGLGSSGSAETGEVEDYSFPILNAAETANNDEFTVSRNSQANQLDVLANDFETVDNQLTIVGRNINGTRGTVVTASDGRSIFYTPPNGFVGRDVFAYTVRDQFGQDSVATVVVNVSFQSTIPIAVDDAFEVPEGSVNRALNVLDNDVASLAGGISITSVAAGDRGGTIRVIGGGQSISYTPLPGFNGTEQFVYSIQDAAGFVSSATVTVNLLPGSRNDDVIDYSIGTFDVVNDRPITNVQVGDTFNVRVFVDDLRTFQANPGVASAFLDLLYSDELVATQDTGVSSQFPFDLTFGPFFSGSGTLQSADSQVPGLLDDVGGVQPIQTPQNHTGPVELFTVTMQAVAPGVAVFAADPADDLISDTTVIGSDFRLTPSQMRLGRSELTISASGTDFPSAIDDSFPTGVDSDGNIIGTGDARLDVLANDNFGPTGTLQEFGVLVAPQRGTVTINNAGTDIVSDDYLVYTPDAGASGFDRFTYVIVSGDGVRSTAEVTMAIGNAAADDLVEIDFALVDSNGTPTSSVDVGDRFGVQVIVEDLRSGIDVTYVFAAFLDMLYDSDAVRPANTNTGDDFDFDVVFGSDFNTEAAVGTAARAGVIDEFGTLLVQATAQNGGVANPNLMATVFFDAVSAGTTNIVGGPADAFPFQDTLLFGNNDPITVDRIRYDSLTINISGPQSELHNSAMPADVNNDGDVSAIDALLVMNKLNLDGLQAEQVGTSYFYDVSGEGNISSIDALKIINELNRKATRFEGEAVSALLDDDEEDVLGLLADDVLNQWN